MLQIRIFERRVLDLFSEGKLFGTTHAYIGQEANAVGVISCLNKNDIVVSNHRCHGHYIAHKNNPYVLLCELMGKTDGLCAGRGGSQHICDDGFFSNGIQGGIMPLAAGLAFAEKYNKTNKIVVVFIGDGTLGQGVVYETLNIASKWRLPLFVVIENNRYAQSTKIEYTLSGRIKDRVTAFDIGTSELSTFDVREIYENSKLIIEKIRKEKKPKCLILNTYRFVSHSKSDDGRSKEEIEKWLNKDPLKLIEKEFELDQIEKEKNLVSNELDKIINKALESPLA